MKTCDAMKETYDFCELFDQEVLYTECRIDPTTVPNGLYHYWVRGCDDDPGCPANIEDNVAVNFLGTIISRTPLKKPEEPYKEIFHQLNYLGEQKTLQQYL